MRRHAASSTCRDVCSTLSSEGASGGAERSAAGYAYGGARALVALHQQHLRAFLMVWRQAQQAGVVLPEGGGYAYRSLETLLLHVLSAARAYLVWLCRNLQLGDPGLQRPPELDDVAGGADEYVEHLIERYAPPLRDVAADRFTDETYRFSRAQTTAEGLLEHAVMHPIRHSFQLRNLMSQQAD